MIAGIGIDLIEVARIRENIDRRAFLQRTFTPAELVECEGAANTCQRLAGKFAAKEAFMKAAGQGIRQGVWFTQIEVLATETGAPVLTASGQASVVLSSLGIKAVHLSITHSAELAAAVVVLEH
jgi:holo-[acyl-carrier protein] synthase